MLRGSTSALALDSAESPYDGDNSSVDALRPKDGLKLGVTGDPKQGYSVALLFNGQSFARHNQGGEFSALFQNEERSVEDRVDSWKATSWCGGSASGDSTHIVLDGECRLKNLNTTVFVRVDYEIITTNVVRKRIHLHQDDMFMLFYQLSNRLEPLQAPAKFWSFDQPDCKGGALREYFPAAGFCTKDDLCVGLLTDSGYRNQWSRLIRRDGKPVKPAPRRIPDANLYSSSRQEDRNKGDFFVQQTFGEILTEKDGPQDAQVIALPGFPPGRNKAM